MEDFFATRTALREQFYALVKSRAPDERLIEFIKSTLHRGNRFNIRTLEMVLDLTLSVVDSIGEVEYNYTDTKYSSEQQKQSDRDTSIHQDTRSPDINSSYDADDEGLEENFIFPCHILFDDCHPELLCNYHREHLRSSRTSTQIIKHPKLCEILIEFAFKSLKIKLESTRNIKDFTAANNHTPSTKLPTNVEEQVLTIINKNESNGKNIDIDIDTYINSTVVIVKRLNKVCANEKKNCRILSRTNILNLILKNTLYLTKNLPHKQHIYLEVFLRFAFTLADYRITGDDLKQLLGLIKDENADLNVVLSSFEQLLSHHYRILKNIQPLKSINFPTASRTAEEIESNSYLSNSWHWRLRSKVIEYKKKRSRSFEKQQASGEKNQSIKLRGLQEKDENQEREVANNPNRKLDSFNANKISPSWLECSLITPLSIISPLIHNGEVKLSCSLWMSLCGDLLVTNENKPKKNLDSNSRTIDLTNLNGHWLRLTSKKRSKRLFMDMSIRKNSQLKRLSIKRRKRQAYDKEDEEKEEMIEKIRRSELELSQISRSGFSRFMNPSKSSLSGLRAGMKASGSFNKKSVDIDSDKGKSQIPPKEFLGRRARDNSQEALMHILSFAIDTLTIEIWLNVKCMTFCARACRVASEGQTKLLDQVTFPSHLKADGSWSHIVFCLDETHGPRGNLQDKIMNFKVIVNGLHKEKEKLVYTSLKSPLTNFACLLGCERSTFGYVWKLSQVNIYKNVIPIDMPIYLLGKGPDFWSFTNFRQQSTLPLPDVTQRNVKSLLHPRLLERYSEIDEGKALNWLTQNIVIAFFAHQPDYFLDYSSAMVASSLMNPLPIDHEFNNSAERFIQAKVLNFSRSLKFNTNVGFGSALVEVGGIESFLVCFADVIRRVQDSSATIHSLALSILLRMSQTNQHHLFKFLDELNGLKLIEFIMAHPDCSISRQMLDYYLDFCLMKKDEHNLIKSPKLVYHLLSCWRAWHKDLQVAGFLYKRLIRLLQPNDSLRRNLTQEERKLESFYINHNYNMMTLAGSLDILMGILREGLVPLDDCAPKINHYLVELIVNLISLLIKHPPGLDVILDITEFLFFLHPDHKSYVEASSDRTSFLHPLYIDTNIEQSKYGMPGSRARTPHSETSSSYRNSLDNINDNASHDIIDSVDNVRSHFCASDTSCTSNEDVFEDYDFYMKQRQPYGLKISLNQYNLIEEQEAIVVTLGKERVHWKDSTNMITTSEQGYIQTNNYPNVRVELAPGQRCSNRNFAIANIADMLASIVKLISTDPMKILSEALLKSIIDPRKLVILANNNSSLVREKVLRLFLYCTRACYSLNLRPILNRYEQDRRGSSFRSCLPIQLMGRQLLKYPTTVKMIQFCFGIIVDIDNFENVEVCSKFDIETMNNNLQLNALILLIQLMTKLRKPEEIVSPLKFVYAYVEQLMNLGEDDILSVLVESSLVECLMKIYFSYVEYEVLMDNCQNLSQQNDEDSLADDYDRVLKELDKTLVLIVRYFIQNLETEETIKCLDDLLAYFDLMNTYVPTKFHYILRDRKVKVLMSSVRYCEHYRDCARLINENSGGQMKNILIKILPIKDMKTFSNYLSNSQLELDISQDDIDFKETSSGTKKGEKLNSRTRSEPEIQVNAVTNGHNGRRCHNDDLGDGTFTANLNGKRHDDYSYEIKISEKDVIVRLGKTIEFAINFIITRESGVIPSPLERGFIIKCIKMLSSYLNEYDNLMLKNAKQKWFAILDRLMRPSEHYRMLRENFSFLILYLLSPCDSMNLDERKYYVSELLKMFDANQLVNLLADKTTLTILAMFLNDLISHNSSQFNSEDSDCEQDDEPVEGDTEEKLKILIKKIEDEITPRKDGRQNNGFTDDNKRVRISSDNLECDIWMEKLAQIRENSREKMVKSKNENQIMDDIGFEYPNDSANSMIDEALQITRDVVNDKNEQRKAFFEDIKQNKIYNYHIRQQWLSLIIGHTHERAIWHLEGYYPKSWELNPIEGPSRIRRRLRPCKLILESRYFRKPKRITKKFSEFKNTNELDVSMNNLNRMNGRTSSVQSDLLANDWYNHYSPHPLCSMIINHEQSIDSNELRVRMFTTETIPFNCDCSIIRPNEVCDGEVSIASWCVHFIGDRLANYQQHISNIQRFNQQVSSANNGDVVVDDSGYEGRINSMTITGGQTSIPEDMGDGTITQTNRQNLLKSIIVEDLWFDEIVEIWDRRYQLQDVGLEIFLTNNMTYLLGFKTTRDKEEFKQKLMQQQHKMINLQRYNLNTDLKNLTQIWVDGRLTNFDYLTCLNKLAGRSFNDLMQYPVFPFVLSNYTTHSLDLEQASNFRDLKKPMAVQDPEKEVTFINNYHNSISNNLSVGLSGMKKPYHYGNHYSNSATVLHFLVRLPPFTQMLIQYQDNNFDQPDRTFHSLANTWQLITRDSNTDFKELIPEFFFLPEMFLNLEQFELGLKQNNELVDDVKLPPWCPNSDARLFTLIHRQALESLYVSKNLHHWIDLIFGYKQTGKAAVEALNVFHPATYYGIIDSVGQPENSSNSLSQISSTIATLSARSSTYGSDYITNADMNTSYLSPTTGHNTIPSSRRTKVHFQREQADIERLALETMIKTYGQMPRQLFVQATRPRTITTPVPIIPSVIQQQFNSGIGETNTNQVSTRLEPLKRIKGLRWGSYVGSPDESDITAIRHKRITPEDTTNKGRRNTRNHQITRNSTVKFSLCLLPNGDVAILKDNTSIMLDYRADRKSGGGNYQPSSTSARYSKRAGLSSSPRVNPLNMIISRQSSYIEPTHISTNQFESANASSSHLVSMTSSRAKFSPDSLSLVSWFYLDGTIRIRHPALSLQKPNVPLVQAGSIVDSVSTCASVPELNLLLVGYESGSICAHIVSTSHETVPIAQYNSPPISVSAPVDALASISAAPSAVHFLHTTTSSSSSSSYAPLGPGKVTKNSLTGQPYTAMSLAGKTLQSVRSINKTTRWLYCHSKKINCMRINTNFEIVVTGSEDGTCVIWDLNSLTYVRTIDYKMKQRSSNRNRKLPNKSEDNHSQTFERKTASPDHQDNILSDFLCSCSQWNSKTNCCDDDQQYECLGSHGTRQGCICASGIGLIAISDTLGDIVSIKDINNRIAEATDSDGSGCYDNMSTVSGSRSSKQSESSTTSVLYCHTINGSLVGIVNCHSQIKAVCYSSAPEGISVNVIVVGLADGLISLYNSWDLSRIKEFHISGLSSPITSLLYSRDNQLLYIVYEDGQLVVLKNKKKTSITMPKEWLL